MKLLYLSSKNAITGNSSNFEVQLTNTLTIEEGGRFRIDQLRLGVAFMLVNESNRKLYFREGPSIMLEAELEIGQYDSQALATTLAFVINATRLQGRVTCQYSTVSACTILAYTPPANQPSWEFKILNDAEVTAIVGHIGSIPSRELEEFHQSARGLCHNQEWE